MAFANINTRIFRLKRALLSSEFLVAILLYGQIFYFIGLHFLHIKSFSMLIGAYYTTVYLLIFKNILQKKLYSHKVSIADVLFVFFVVLIVFSYFFNLGSQRQIIYLPFFVIMAYMSGRLCFLDIEKFIAVSARFQLLSLALFVIALVFLKQSRDSLYGYNHLILLFGFVMAAFAVTLVGNLLITKFKNELNSRFFIKLALLCITIFFLTYGMARGWALSLFIVIAILIMSHSWVRWRKKIFLFIVVVGCMSAGVAIQKSFYNLAFDTIGSLPFNSALDGSHLDLYQNSNSVAARMVMWKMAWNSFLQNPILGCGAGTISNFPHSTILHILAELGMFGIVIFAAFIVAIANMAMIFIKLQFGNTQRNLFYTLMSLWLLCLIGDQIYGHYMMSLAFFTFSGILVSLFVRQNGEA